MNLSVTCSTCFEPRVSDGVCSACHASQAEPNRDRRALPLWTLLSDRYLIGRVLGAGGFGITYLARDQQLLRRVALKEFFPRGLVSRADDRQRVEYNGDDDRPPFERGLARFFREGRLLAKFDHANIVRVHEVLNANGTAYLAMEFLDGITLKEWITSVGRLPLDKALHILEFLTDALRAVHAEGVVHRDVKPDNVYVTRQGRTLLLDFGGAKQLAGEGEQSRDAMFAHGYAPPEQYFAESDRIGPWTDVYACGATLYKMLTGRTPQPSLERHANDPPLDFSDVDVPPAVQQVIARAMTLAHAGRYPTIQAFAEALRDAVGGFATTAPPPASPRPPPAPQPPPAPPPHDPPVPRTPRRVSPTLVGVGALVVGLAAFGIWRSTSSPGPVDAPEAAGSAPAPIAENQAASPSPPASAPTPAASTPVPLKEADRKRIDEALRRLIEGGQRAQWSTVEAAQQDVAAIQAAAGGVPPEGSAVLRAAQEAIERRDYARAAAALKETTAAQPRSARAWLLLAMAQQRMGNLDAAERALNEGLRLQPADPQGWATLAEVRAAQNSSYALAAVRLAAYFSTQRREALDYLRDEDLASERLRALVRDEGKHLEQLPTRTR